jgi:hypothetical protein
MGGKLRQNHERSNKANSAPKTALPMGRGRQMKLQTHPLLIHHTFQGAECVLCDVLNLNIFRSDMACRRFIRWHHFNSIPFPSLSDPTPRCAVLGCLCLWPWVSAHGRLWDHIAPLLAIYFPRQDRLLSLPATTMGWTASIQPPRVLHSGIVPTHSCFKITASNIPLLRLPLSPKHAFYVQLLNFSKRNHPQPPQIQLPSQLQDWKKKWRRTKALNCLRGQRRQHRSTWAPDWPRKAHRERSPDSLKSGGFWRSRAPNPRPSVSPSFPPNLLVDHNGYVPFSS